MEGSQPSGHGEQPASGQDSDQKGLSQQELEAAQHLIDHAQSSTVGSPPPETSRAAVEAVEDARQRGVSVEQGDASYLANPADQHSHFTTINSSYGDGQNLQQLSPGETAAPGGQMCSNCGTNKTPLWRRSPAGAIICNACGLYYKARNQMRPVGLKRGTVVNGQAGPSNSAPDRGASPTSLQGGATYVSADQSVNGTCPGGGRCNGTGGQEACNGCPAYNNRVSKTAQIALQQAHPPNSPHVSNLVTDYNASRATSVVVACQNCGTTITPLWRRDEHGHTICNACGLYHKLHGTHRPVQMKKSEIKRRKRVVPVEQPSYQASTPGESASIPTPSEPSRSPYQPPAPQLAAPIPVDFTDSYRRHHITDPNFDQSSSASRKRSFGSSVRDDGGTPPQPGSTADDRRAELQREAESMRRLLLEKEREIAALGDHGEDAKANRS